MSEKKLEIGPGGQVLSLIAGVSVAFVGLFALAMGVAADVQLYEQYEGTADTKLDLPDLIRLIGFGTFFTTGGAVFTTAGLGAILTAFTGNPGYIKLFGKVFGGNK